MCRNTERAGEAGQAKRKETDMFTMVTENTRRSISTVAAVAVVAFAGLTLDQGHLGTLPQGTVEVGELTPVDVMQMAAVMLPEVVVTGQRIEAAQFASDLPVLPEVQVVARREVQLASVPAGEPARS
jgi:hypothetical protein